MLAHTTVNSTCICGNTDQSTSTCIEVFDALGRFFKWYRDVSNEHLHVLVNSSLPLKCVVFRASLVVILSGKISNHDVKLPKLLCFHRLVTLRLTDGNAIKDRGVTSVGYLRKSC